MNFVLNGKVAEYMKSTDAAILFSHIYYWCVENKNKEINCHKDAMGVDRFWTFDTTKTFCKKFFFLSEKQIRNNLARLEEEGLIVTGNFNKSSYDRTKWYSVTEKGEELIRDNSKDIFLYSQKGESIFPKGQMEVPERANGSSQKGEPIPHNNTHNDTNKNTNTNPIPSTPTDTLCGSERSTNVSPSSPEPTPFDEPSPFDETSEQVATQHSAKPNEEQKKSRSSAKSSFPNEYYKTVFDAYITNYKTLMSTGRLRTPLPKIAIMSIKGTLKKYFTAYGYETILKAVKESVNDDWLVEHGYVFHHIFGERKLLMLINGIKFENKANESKSAYVQRVKSGNINYNEEW